MTRNKIFFCLNWQEIFRWAKLLYTYGCYSKIVYILTIFYNWFSPTLHGFVWHMCQSFLSLLNWLLSHHVSNRGQERTYFKSLFITKIYEKEIIFSLAPKTSMIKENVFTYFKYDLDIWSEIHKVALLVDDVWMFVDSASLSVWFVIFIHSDSPFSKICDIYKDYRMYSKLFFLCNKYIYI